MTLYAPHFEQTRLMDRWPGDGPRGRGKPALLVPAADRPVQTGKTGLGKLGDVYMPTPCDSLVRHVLRDEALTRGLGDIEARMLVEWVTDWTELLAEAARSEDDAWSCVQRLCRRGRAIGRFVQLWGEPASRGAASQLAAAERFGWPLPTTGVDAGDLMHHILTWENQHPEG